MKVGVWLVGARGSVATTVVVGAAAVKRGLSAAVGCVTELPVFASCAMPGIEDLVFGGHDIMTTPLTKRAERLAEGGAIPARILNAMLDDLVAADAEIRPGAASADATLRRWLRISPNSASAMAWIWWWSSTSPPQSHPPCPAGNTNP